MLKKVCFAVISMSMNSVDIRIVYILVLKTVHFVQFSCDRTEKIVSYSAKLSYLCIFLKLKCKTKLLLTLLAYLHNGIGIQVKITDISRSPVIYRQPKPSSGITF